MASRRFHIQSLVRGRWVPFARFTVNPTDFVRSFMPSNSRKRVRIRVNIGGRVVATVAEWRNGKEL